MSGNINTFLRDLLNHEYVSLYRYEYATFKEIKTQTISMQNDRAEGNQMQKKAKLFIRLEKHEKFEENMKKFEEIKAENEAKRNATKKEEDDKQ